MRDLVAIVVVIALVAFALRMATSLQWHRQSDARQRRAIQAEGRTIVAEVPSADGLRFFTEDATSFHWDGRELPKREIRSARVLISGAPISACVSSRFPAALADTPLALNNPPDAFERDRWDVDIDLGDERVLVECGAIREQVSQELARHVFEAVRRAVEAKG